MTAREESHSSKSFASPAYDSSLLPPVSGPSRGRLLESSVGVTDAISAAPLIEPETSSSQQSNAAAGFKSNSIIPGNSCLRPERAVMQSCWIQRLTPACKTIDYEKEKPTELNHVWTHFTKDFSSCSKRLHKAHHHHTRSSSWPPKELPPNLSPLSHKKPMELVDIKEQYLLYSVNREENLRVPSESHDFCVRAGNLFNSSYKSVSMSEALVPRSQHRGAPRTCDESCEGENREVDKLQGYAAQHFQCLSKDGEKVTSAVGGDFTVLEKPLLHPGFNRVDGLLQEAASLRVVGDAPFKGKFAASKFAHRIVHVRGSSPDAVIGTSLSPVLMGASADADRIPLSPSLVKDVNPLSAHADLFKFSNSRLCKTPPLRTSLAFLDCETSVPAVVFEDAENEINQTKLGAFHKKNSGVACDMEVKARRNFGFLYFQGQNKDLNQSTENPRVFSGAHNGVGSDRFCVGNRGSDMRTASKSIQRKTDVGASTLANNAVPFVSEHYDDSRRSFITDLRKSGPLSSKEELASKMPLTRVSSRDFTRHSLRETSQKDHGVQLFEDAGTVKPLETGSSTASPPQKYITEESDKHHLNMMPNTSKIDGKERLRYFSCPSPHTHLDTNAQAHYSGNLLQQAQVSQRKSLIQSGLGLNQGGSADRIPSDGSIMPRKLQIKSLHLSKGDMERLDLQTENKDFNFQSGSSDKDAAGVGMLFGHQSYKFCDDGRTSDASRPKQAWIQRWRSSSNLIASGDMISPSFGNDGDLGSDPAKVPVISSHRVKKGIATEVGRKSNKHMEGLPYFDSGSGSIPRGSFPAYRNHASFRGTYMVPSAEAMAIASKKPSNKPSKLHTTSLLSGGSFSVWPFPRADAVEGRLAEHAQETVGDNMHGMDVDDLEFLEMQMR
eukprot:c22813_g1_i2 orf=1061-3739(+)